jgi:eukaryotic-like serine/threonine-protein kinase
VILLPGTRLGSYEIVAALGSGGMALLTAPPAELDGTTLIPITEPGIVMGTVGYMSPEQVRGHQADERSDLFSFGAVLNEMLAGCQAFPGETASDRMAAILHADPAELPASVPPTLDRIVRHCLEKRPEDRFRAAHDLAFNLEALASLSSGGSQGAPPAAARRGRPLAPVLLAVLLLAAAVAGAALARWLWRDPSPSLPTFKQLTFRRGTIFTARFAPDGEAIIYGAAWGINSGGGQKAGSCCHAGSFAATGPRGSTSEELRSR